jgi:F-type H+-transporting ATPase subunit alpha
VEFVASLRSYIKNNKPKFVEIVSNEKKLTDEAETLLKEAIVEAKQAFSA